MIKNEELKDLTPQQEIDQVKLAKKDFLMAKKMLTENYLVAI